MGSQKPSETGSPAKREEMRLVRHPREGDHGRRAPWIPTLAPVIGRPVVIVRVNPATRTAELHAEGHRLPFHEHRAYPVLSDRVHRRRHARSASADNEEWSS